MSFNLKTAHRRAKRALIRAVVGSGVHVWGLWSLLILGALNDLWGSLDKTVHNSETVDRRAKRALIWAPGGIVVHVWCVWSLFILGALNDLWGSLDKTVHNSETVDHRAKRALIWAPGVVEYIMYMYEVPVHFWFWVHSMTFDILWTKWSITRKQLIVEQKDHYLSPGV